MVICYARAQTHPVLQAEGRTDNVPVMEFVHHEFDGDVYYSTDPKVFVLPESAVFSIYVQEWHEERGITSSPIEMARCPSYRQIIKMGRRALPFIMDDLEKHKLEPDFWFMALHEITGENPIPEEDYGKTTKMAEAWLAWWRNKRGR
jgi:hypothetical protein